MNSFFPKPQTPQAPAPPTPPPSNDDAARSAAALSAGKIRKGEGYSGTILTSGAGDTSTAPTKKKTLLGD